ncbi:DNA repair protein isoform 2 [Galdieria sulphuraria]|uniref:DNA repair protein isoform 2 n=1 Tax=Galdieria sulphuraria TaxID=130081 RepID=M2W9C6_GALSU|nr:DNA repair protein isoform 2 [Galdieria sulphuraria]EME32481.1 DNA repair protein isoform 2 [Galdieria sulphuraria]|eukprot:XP_005709001.1 DNA repair protein isoform 2 [Galdieria sulphuraria]
MECRINNFLFLRMKEAGFHTISSIIMTTKKNLLAVKGLSEAKVDKVRECAYKISNSSFISGLEVRERRKNLIHITTGSSALDELLGGGIETSSITEVFGEFRSGKTQLAHTLCVTAQLPKSVNGAEGRVAYIDTENCFRPERIVEIAERFELDPEEVLDNILVARAYTSEHQIELLVHIAAKMVEETFGLLIVDSATALFRVDYSGRGELSERQQKLNRFMSQLLKLSEQFNLAVFITNQVMSTPDGSAGMFVVDPKKPVGGHVIAHASTTRIMLRKGRGEQRVAKIYDSPMLAENEATFEVSSGGVIDAKD